MCVELQESNVRLKLTIVDTVGFGDQINKEDSYLPIVEYINQQFENYLQVCFANPQSFTCWYEIHDGSTF